MDLQTLCGRWVGPGWWLSSGSQHSGPPPVGRADTVARQMCAQLEDMRLQGQCPQGSEFFDGWYQSYLVGRGGKVL